MSGSNVIRAVIRLGALGLSVWLVYLMFKTTSGR